MSERAKLRTIKRIEKQRQAKYNSMTEREKYIYEWARTLESVSRNSPEYEKFRKLTIDTQNEVEDLIELQRRGAQLNAKNKDRGSAVAPLILSMFNIIILAPFAIIACSLWLKERRGKYDSRRAFVIASLVWSILWTFIGLYMLGVALFE